MTHFDNMGMMSHEFQANWHDKREDIGQVINVDASTNKKSKFAI